MDRRGPQHEGKQGKLDASYLLTASPLHNPIARKHFQLFNGLV
jgi:hypothetical protein